MRKEELCKEVVTEVNLYPASLEIAVSFREILQWLSGVCTTVTSV